MADVPLAMAVEHRSMVSGDKEMENSDRRTTIGACSKGVEHDAMAEVCSSKACGVRSMAIARVQ